MDHVGLAVHEPAGAHDPRPEGLADGLMAQADAQQGDPPGEAPHALQRDARIVGRAGTRRNNEV
jgi:hypothetical protein